MYRTFRIKIRLDEKINKDLDIIRKINPKGLKVNYVF